MATIYNKRGGQFLNPAMVGDDNFFLHLTRDEVVLLRDLVARGANSIVLANEIDAVDPKDLKTKAFGELVWSYLSDAKHHDQNEAMCEAIRL